MYANDASVPRDNPHNEYSPTLSETEMTEGLRKDLLLIVASFNMGLLPLLQLR